MSKGKGLRLCIVATLMLTTAGIAQDKDQNPDERQLDRNWRARAEQSRMVILVRQTIIPLLQRASKSVGQRYDLDETTINELRQSIHESVEVLLKQPEGMRTLATAARRGNYDKMLETLLSQPDCKMAFAKYLNEEQLQDYIDFTLARVQRDRQAVTRHLTAWYDQQLSLTVDQREKIEQRLVANAGGGWPASARNMLWNQLRPVDVVRQRFKSPPDDVLSQTQSAIWEQLVVLAKFDNARQIPEHARKIVAAIMEPLKANKIAREGGKVLIEFPVEGKDEVMKIEIWGEDIGKVLIDWGEDKDAASESQEKMRWIAEAKLAAHTEQLGPLDESASQRLTLVAKGVVEEYLEARGEDWDSKYQEVTKEIREAVAVGKMTREQAAQKLEDFKKWSDSEEGAPDSEDDITHHPLYQHTIEDVLSDEAFAQYKEHQAERLVFRGQALRDVVVASMDAELFLSDEQRKHFETTFAELSTSSATDEVPAPVYMAYQLFQQTDHELLSPWQREEFERIHRELEAKSNSSKRNENVET